MATRTTHSKARRITRRAWLGLVSGAAAGLAALKVGRRARRRIIWIGHI